MRSDIISGYNTNIFLKSNISIMETRETQIQPKFRFTLSTKINDITSNNILAVYTLVGLLHQRRRH